MQTLNANSLLERFSKEFHLHGIHAVSITDICVINRFTLAELLYCDFANV